MTKSDFGWASKEDVITYSSRGDLLKGPFYTASHEGFPSAILQRDLWDTLEENPGAYVKVRDDKYAKKFDPKITLYALAGSLESGPIYDLIIGLNTGDSRLKRLMGKMPKYLLSDDSRACLLRFTPIKAEEGLPERQALDICLLNGEAGGRGGLIDFT